MLTHRLTTAVLLLLVVMFLNVSSSFAGAEIIIDYVELPGQQEQQPGLPPCHGLGFNLF